MNRVPTYVFCLLVLLVPFIYVPDAFDFTLHPRQLAIQFGLVLALIAWGFTGGQAKNHVLSLPLIIWACWSVLSVLWAINPVEGLVQANRIFMFTLLALTVSHQLNVRDIRAVYHCAGLAGAIAACIGIAQYFGWGFAWIPTVGNPGATFGYRNFAAGYLVVLIPVALAFAWQSPGRKTALLWGLSAALMALFLAYTRTRGAWLGLGVALGAGALMLIALRRPLWPVSRPRIALVLAGLALVILCARVPDRMAKTGKFGFDELKSDAATALTTAFSPSHSRGRTVVWSHTLDMVWDHPLAGVGLGSWQYAYPPYDQGDWITHNAAPQRPHNDLLWTLSETGVIGLGLYFWVLGSAFSLVWKQLKHHPDRPETAWIFGIAIGLLAHIGDGFFSFSKERMAPALMFWLGLGCIAALSSTPSRHTLRPALWLALPVLLCGMVLSHRHLQFDRHYLQAQHAWRNQNWPHLELETEAALTWGPFNHRAFLLKGLARHRQGDHRAAIAAYLDAQRYHPNDGHNALALSYEALGESERALIHHRAEWRIFPKSTIAGLALADALFASGQWNEAADLYTRVCDLHAGHPTAWLGLLQAQERTGNPDAAFETAKRAVALLPHEADLHAHLIRLSQARGDWQTALEAARHAVRLSPDNARMRNNLGAILSQLQAYTEAETAYREALRLQPDYARVHHNLGDLYAAQRDTIRAISAYETFVQTWQGDPQFADLARQKIQALKR